MVQKIIRVILDILLLVGAAASVLTIDGGKWWIHGVTIYPSREVSWSTDFPNPEKYLDSGIPVTGSSAQSAPACLTMSLPAIPNWYDAYLMRSAYQNPGSGPASNGKGYTTCY
jgi:hypothetical protein